MKLLVLGANLTKNQVLIDGVAEAIAAYAANGWTMAIACNADGSKTREQVVAEMRYTLSLLPVKIKEALFCLDNGETCFSITPPIRFEYVPNRPHDSISGVIPVHNEADSHRLGLNGTYRKPNAGMLKAIEGDFIVYKKKLMIGDTEKDFGAAVRANFGYMHVSAWVHPFLGK